MNNVSGGGNGQLALLEEIKNLKEKLSNLTETKQLFITDITTMINSDIEIETASIWKKGNTLSVYMQFVYHGTLSNGEFLTLKEGYRPVSVWKITPIRDSTSGAYAESGTLWLSNQNKPSPFYGLDNGKRYYVEFQIIT